MKQLLLCILASVIFISCRTEKHELTSPNGVEFFTSEAELQHQVRKAIGDDFGPVESFRITKIDYYEDAKKSLGLITYQANGRERTNILFAVTPASKKLYKCTTAGCACSVRMYRDDTSGENAYECGGCNNDCHWEVTDL